MDRADMDRVRDDFERAATMAEEAGFDILELHFAHGYLLSNFISPLTNQRADQYGGTLENRMRFPLEVFDAVRAVWPDHKPIAVRIQETHRAVSRHLKILWTANNRNAFLFKHWNEGIHLFGRSHIDTEMMHTREILARNSFRTLR